MSVTGYYLLTYDDPKDRDYKRMKETLIQVSDMRACQLGPKTTFLFQVDGPSHEVNLGNIFDDVTDCLDPKEGCATLIELSTGAVWNRQKGKKKWTPVHTPEKPFEDWEPAIKTLRESLAELQATMLAEIENEE